MWLSCLFKDLPSLPTPTFSVFLLFVTLNYSLFWRVFLVLKVFPWNRSRVIYLETGGYSSGTALCDVIKNWVSVATEVNKTMLLMAPCSLLKEIRQLSTLVTQSAREANAPQNILVSLKPLSFIRVREPSKILRCVDWYGKNSTVMRSTDRQRRIYRKHFDHMFSKEFHLNSFVLRHLWEHIFF